MPAVPLPITDGARLAALDATEVFQPRTAADGEAQDGPDVGFDSLTRLATDVLHVPMAAVALLDGAQVRWIAPVGMPGPALHAADSLCRRVVVDGTPMVVADVAVDPRADLAAVADLGVAAWACYPVRSSEGQVLGTFAVGDVRARRWSAEDLDVVERLAACAGAQLAAYETLGREHRARREAEARASLLRASHEASIDGVLVVSPDGRMVSYNSRFGAIWPIPDDVIARGSDDEALASVLDKLVDPDAFLNRVRELYAARRPGRDELRMRDGRVLDRYGTPLVREDGSYLGYAWYVRDVTAERAGEAALTVSEARYRSLVQALSNEVWYATGEGHLLSDMPVWRSITGQSEEELLNGGWLAGIHPDDRPRVAAAWAAAVASRSPYRTEYRIRPVAGTPAEREAGTRTIEVRGVPLERDDGVAEWVGVHVDVTELRSAESERAALAAAAHAAAERTRALQRVTAALAGAVTTADVMAVILEQGEQELQAAASGIALRDGDHVHYHALKGYGADVQDAWRDFAVAVASPVPYVLRTGRPLFLGSRAEILARFPALEAFLDASGEQALARLPLRTPTGTIGVLSLGFTTERTFMPEEQDYLVALAGQCAQALERAQLYERVRDTALLLQRSLLPEALPTTPGYDVAARYLPGSADIEVGGDWYDALHLPDGRLVVAVGDVLGKGVRAASVMGQVRNALRGLIHVDPAPARVLGWLDQVVRQLGGDEDFVTLVYGVLDPAEGVLVWAAAGHPPPLLVPCGGAGARSALLRAEPSLPLGLGGTGPGAEQRTEQRLVLGPGEALLLFTDGLVESRRRPLLDGLVELEELADRLAAEGGQPSTFCDGLLGALVGDAPDDDVTVLLMRRDATAATDSGGARAETVLAAVPPSVPAARRFVDQVLRRWDVHAVSETVLLCTSELVTNAVLHARTEVRLSVRITGTTLRVSVSDNGTAAVPRRARVADSQATRGRGLLIVEALSERWGVDEGERGKTVWFEIDADASVDPPS